MTPSQVMGVEPSTVARDVDPPAEKHSAPQRRVLPRRPKLVARWSLSRKPTARRRHRKRRRQGKVMGGAGCHSHQYPARARTDMKTFPPFVRYPTPHRYRVNKTSRGMRRRGD